MLKCSWVVTITKKTKILNVTNLQLGCHNTQETRDLESDLEIIFDSNERQLGFDIEQGNRDLGSELEKVWMNVEVQLIDQVPIKGPLNLVHRG